MNALARLLSVGSGLLLLTLALNSCKKDDNGTGPTPNVPTYPVSAVVLNPQGQPQGGALLSLKNPPYASALFSTFTDSAGRGTIQSPEGAQVLVASIGSAFSVEVSVNVAASPSGTNAGTVTLVQNTAIRVLVVKASAEQLEDVLRVVGFTTFDSTYIYALRDSANADSARLLTFLRQYTLIFSDCDGGSEGGSSYAALSRVYGRYIQAGGKMYGGHYNFYHLQRVWPPFYTTYDYQGNAATDTISIIDANLRNYIGFGLERWDSPVDSRNLSGYEKFSDLPTGSKVYGVIYRTSPPVGVIVENYNGTGKYLWTDYHNQDVKDDPRLVRIVQYFLLTL
jgi:hypothetical protein